MDALLNMRVWARRNSDDLAILVVLAVVAAAIGGFTLLIVKTEPYTYAGQQRGDAQTVAAAAIANNCPTALARVAVREYQTQDHYAGRTAWRLAYGAGAQHITVYTWHTNYTGRNYSVVVGCGRR